MRKEIQPARLETLEARQLLSVSVDALAGQSSDLVVGATDQLLLVGTIEAPGQADVYSFVAPAASVLTVDMTGQGQIDPLLRLYNDRGRVVRQNNNAAPGVTDSRLSYTLRPGQTYYLRAGAARRTTGDYTLALATRVIDDHGNTYQTASPVSMTAAGKASLSGTINYGTDADMFRLVAVKTGRITLTPGTYARRVGANVRMIAYDAAAVRLGGQDLNTGPFSFDVTQGQVFFIQVLSRDGRSGSYSATLTTQTPVEPAPAPTPGPVTPSAPGAPAPPADLVLAPDASLTARRVQSGGNWELWVLGTDRADTITLSQTGQNYSIASGATTLPISGAVSTVVVYGFGGDDTIRVTSSVAAASFVYGGDGADSIFAAGPAGDWLYGGAGADLLVSVGGGADRVYGQDGEDAFWLDSADTPSDASAAETGAKAVHRISHFYQPYSATQGQANYVPLEVSGQNLADPAITSEAGGYRNFASVPLFVQGPEYNDISQGAVGDCYYLATLAALAQSDPGLVRQMIAPLGDGTFAVRFMNGSQEVYLRLDADLPVSGGSLAYADCGPDHELWVPLMEKAWAYYRTRQNSYASISGGWMGDVFPVLSGVGSEYRTPSQLGSGAYSYLNTQLQAGRGITAGSKSAAGGPIVGGHAYMVKAVSVEGGVQYVTLYNPWGIDGGTSTDSSRYDGLVKLPVAQLGLYFTAFVTGLA